MQTFMPHPSYAQSAASLDQRRLGKQRVEAMQMVRAIMDPSYGWQSHPAVTMWRGHGAALITYGIVICDEWISRGYKDTGRRKLVSVQHMMVSLGERATKPEWVGDEAFHRSHRSNLVRKDPSHYGPLFPGVPDDIEYVWPAGATRVKSSGVLMRKHPLTCPGCGGKKGYTNRGDSLNPWWACAQCGKPTEPWFAASGGDMLNFFRGGPLEGLVYDATTILNDARLLPFLTSYEWTPELVTGSTGRVARVWLHNNTISGTVNSTPSHGNTAPENRSKTMAKNEATTDETVAAAPVEVEVADTEGLEAARNELKISRAKLAEAAGLTVAQVWRIEKGGKRTTVEEATKLRDVLAQLKAAVPTPVEAGSSDPS
jgi:DNA-binding transcriptional regulator YiaG